MTDGLPGPLYGMRLLAAYVNGPLSLSGLTNGLGLGFMEDLRSPKVFRTDLRSIS